MRLAPILVCLFVLGFPSLARAETVYDGFNYPQGSSLAGQNGGFGWNGAWGGSGLTATIAPGLSIGSLTTTGGSVATEAPIPGTVAFYSRQLDTSYGADNTSVYLSFLLRPETGFGFYGGINLGGLFVGKSGPVDLYSIEAPTDDISSSTVAPVAGSTVYLVLHAEFLPGNDRFALYVNPAPGVPQPLTPDAMKTNYDLGSTDFIFLNNAGGWTTDEIRLGSTFESVTSASRVPVPGALTLLTTALPGLAAARWWKRR